MDERDYLKICEDYAGALDRRNYNLDAAWQAMAMGISPVFFPVLVSASEPLIAKYDANITLSDPPRIPVHDPPNTLSLPL